MAQVFIGRQPIFDRDLRLFAYELLFRTGDTPVAGPLDDVRATSEVLVNAFTEFGLDQLVGAHRAFINVPRELLLEARSLPFPKDRVTFEILETVVVDDALVDAVRELAADGASLALDDYIHDPRWEPLLPYAQIIKVDVRGQSLDQAAEEARRLKDHGLRLLAEKVETREEYDALKAAGYDYFQGYFLARPHVLSSRRLPSSKLATLRLLAALQDPEVDVSEVERLTAQDATLGYRLLRYINSASFSLSRQVESVRAAIVYLGLGAVKRWVALLALSRFDDQPPELLITALVRARLCELLAEKADMDGGDRFFTTGLFSTLDALMEQQMEEVLKGLPLSDDVVAALLRREGPMGEALACCIAQERYEWGAVRFDGLSAEAINGLYLEALAWSGEAARPLTQAG